MDTLNIPYTLEFDKRLNRDEWPYENVSMAIQHPCTIDNSFMEIAFGEWRAGKRTEREGLAAAAAREDARLRISWCYSTIDNEVAYGLCWWQ